MKPYARRYFDVVGEEVTLELTLAKPMTVEEIEKELGYVSKLREVSKKEFNELTAKYTGKVK